MTTETYAAFVLASTLLILAPGPTNLMIVSSAMQVGLRRSLWVVGGAACSHALLCALAGFGLVAVLAVSAHVFELLRWLGVAYLLWLGVRQWLAATRAVPQGHLRSTGGAWQGLLQGFLVNTTNPKALIFYGAFFSPFVDTSTAVGPQFALLGATFVALFVVAGLAHALVAARLGRALSGPRSARIQRGISGTLLIGAGIMLAAVERPRS